MRRSFLVFGLIFISLFMSIHPLASQENKDEPTLVEEESSMQREKENSVISIGIFYDITASDDKLAPDTWTQVQTMKASLLARFSSIAFIEGALSFDTSPGTGEVAPDEILSQLYISWQPFPLLALSVGKQRLSWGCARIFSSLDKLETSLNPATYNRKGDLSGTIGLKAVMLLTGELSASLFVAPLEDLSWTRGAFRIDAMIGEIDAGFGLSTFPFDKLVDFTIVPSPLPEVERSRRWSFFVDATWFCDIFGFYAEAQLANARNLGWAYNNAGTIVIKNELSTEADWIFKGTLGMQADIPVWLHGTLQCLFEYHYDAEGFSKIEAEFFNTEYKAGNLLYLPDLIGSGSFGCNYLYAGFRGLPLAQKLNLDASAFVSLDTFFASTSVSLSMNSGEGVFIGLTWRNSRQWYGNSASEDTLLKSNNTISASVTTYF